MALILFGVFLIQFDRNVLTVATVLVACVLLVTGIYQMFSMAPEVDYEAKGEVPLERVGHRLAQQVSNLLQRQPDMAETRETLQAKVFFEGPEAPVRFGRFAVLMAFASVIASIGVVAQSTAVVIGAMLIAPLMTPLLGMALSASMGWLRRFRRAAFVALAGIVVAIGTGVIVGAVSPHHVNVATNTEVLSRISPTILDLAIAVAAGAAGAFALTPRRVRFAAGRRGGHRPGAAADGDRPVLATGGVGGGERRVAVVPDQRHGDPARRRGHVRAGRGRAS